MAFKISVDKHSPNKPIGFCDWPEQDRIRFLELAREGASLSRLFNEVKSVHGRTNAYYFLAQAEVYDEWKRVQDESANQKKEKQKAHETELRQRALEQKVHVQSLVSILRNQTDTMIQNESLPVQYTGKYISKTGVKNHLPYGRVLGFLEAYFSAPLTGAKNVAYIAHSIGMASQTAYAILGMLKLPNLGRVSKATEDEKELAGRLANLGLNAPEVKYFFPDWHRSSVFIRRLMKDKHCSEQKPVADLRLGDLVVMGLEDNLQAEEIADIALRGTAAIEKYAVRRQAIKLYVDEIKVIHEQYRERLLKPELIIN